MNKQLWDGKPWQAFKTVAILFSFGMNLILLIVLLVMAPLILPTVNDVARPIVSGLNSSFVDMNQATIRRTIQVSDTIPVMMTVPLRTETTVSIVSPVPLQEVPATFTFPDGGGEINGVVTLALPAGLDLPVTLNLQVPINEELPVELAVDAVIPLSETELGAPFSRLQQLFAPLDDLLNRLPANNRELRDRVTGDPPARPPAVSATGD